ncbi:hypothetical protein V7S43_005090 [Phytophthora oleae]|uniref:Protein kinase domain-containing protein n=1 Tax=Phytophthora oleae TaxID=2107226 RepID=A0ABD3FXM7_9STRA
MYAISSSFLGDECGGTPYAVNIVRADDCTAEPCTSSNTSSADMRTVECSADPVQATRSKFWSSPYIIELVYADETCSDFAMGYGYPASGTCAGGYNETDSYYVIASLNDNGSASIELFPVRSCLSTALYSVKAGDKEAIATHECDANWFKWYSSNDVETSGSSSASSSSAGEDSSASLSNGAILGIVIGVFAFLMVFLLGVFIRQRQGKSDDSTESKTSLRSVSASSLEAAIRGQTGLWNDDIITTKRVPRAKVLTEELISRGSFGEVYEGFFNDRQVAVKMPLPASRDNITLVNEFLAEAKMTATMDHPHIVSFIGVAWDSLSDLCVVLEYMDGGELRSLLNNYMDFNRPIGFDRQKATIALQVCHALTYLHSLMPSVIHRDLKSRNILLNRNVEAKLSDFGISRERLDRTMTAGVGTSLWMAPEVMLGERYDDKADMFSFGVVLSELDVHSLPYTRARKENLDSNGREMADSILLQKVALGTLHVEFSNPKPRSIGELGRACISIDPTERPSAAEALYRLQVILSKRRIL